MVAVIKFHRNACYQPDLSGEPGGANFLGDSCRVKEEEIVVSDAVAIGNLAADATIPLTFRFAAAPPFPSTRRTFRCKWCFEASSEARTTRWSSRPRTSPRPTTSPCTTQPTIGRLSDSLFETTPTGAADTFTSVSIALRPCDATSPSGHACGTSRAGLLATRVSRRSRYHENDHRLGPSQGVIRPSFELRSIAGFGDLPAQRRNRGTTARGRCDAREVYTHVLCNRFSMVRARRATYAEVRILLPPVRNRRSRRLPRRRPGRSR